MSTPGGVCPGDLSDQNIPGLGPGHFLADEEVVGPEQYFNPTINYSGVDRDMIMSNTSREPMVVRGNWIPCKAPVPKATPGGVGTCAR